MRNPLSCKPVLVILGKNSPSSSVRRRRAEPRGRRAFRVAAPTWAWLLGVPCWGAEGAALAQEARSACAPGARPWVLVELDRRLAAPLRDAVVRDLAAGLPRMVVCTEAPSRAAEPASTVVLTRQENGATIEVRDAVTDKRVSRDVDLSGIPLDGHALALAVASDELLRASWSELALRRRERRSTPPPPEVDAAVQDVLVPRAPEERRGHELAVRAAFERYGSGQILFGGDAVYALRLDEALVIEAWLGLRRGVPVQAPSGTVDVDAWVSGVGVRYMWGEGGPWRWGPFIGFQGGQAEFTGRPRDSATRATPLRGPLATVRGGAACALGLGPFVTGLAGGAGLPLARLDATDGGVFVSGISGPELWLQLSVGGAF